MTGKVIWKSAQETADLAGYGSPVAATLSGVRQYVVFLGKGVVGVGAETGNPLWRYKKTANGSPANILTPVIQGNYVYTGSNQGGGGLIEIKLDREPIVKEYITHRRCLFTWVGLFWWMVRCMGRRGLPSSP